MRVRGVFDDWNAMKSALAKLKEITPPPLGGGDRGGVHGYTAYGPVNLQEIEDLMPAKSSYVRGWSTAGGLIGLATFLVMCVMTSLIYSLVVGGKPPVSNVPYVIPTYEGTILIGAIAALIAGLVYARLRSRPLPADYDTRFSGDTFGVDVTCEPSRCDEVKTLLADAGAVEVHEL